VDDELNELSLLAGSGLAIELDWDGYPTTDVDLDLYLYQLGSGAPVEVASSTTVQDGSTAPAETIVYTATTTGNYGIAVVGRSGVVDGLRFRVFLFPTMVYELEHWQDERSLLDAAHCAAALTVGAVLQNDYDSGWVWRHSSQGPTTDDRIKPDIVAPTAVRTSVLSTFHGTSAAAPHVAGAVALYTEANGGDALLAGTQLLEDAVAMGGDIPNNISGHGRLMLASARAGWQCEPGIRGPCFTTCNSTGEGLCGDDCHYQQCQPPLEICNDVDDNCDGAVDEGCPEETEPPPPDTICACGAADQPAAPAALLCTLLLLRCVRLRVAARRQTGLRLAPR